MNVYNIDTQAENGDELVFNYKLNTRINEWEFRHLRENKLRTVIASCLSHLNVWQRILDEYGSEDEWFTVYDGEVSIIGDLDESLLENDSINFILLSKPLYNLTHVTSIQWKEWPYLIAAEAYMLRRKTCRDLYNHMANNLGSIDQLIRQYFGTIDYEGAYIHLPSVATKQHGT